MKTFYLGTLLLFVMLFSCSTDQEQNADSTLSSSSLIGYWSFSELDTEGATDNVELSNDILSVLVASGCDILSYDFKSDMSVTASVRDYTETGNSVNESGTGLLIECPSNVVTSTSVWELNDDQLSFINSDNEIETITIELDGDILIVPGEVINEDNLAGTDAIFVRQ
jgi:hypothetical protein